MKASLLSLQYSGKEYCLGSRISSLKKYIIFLYCFHCLCQLVGRNIKLYAFVHSWSCEKSVGKLETIKISSGFQIGIKRYNCFILH